MIAHRLTLQIDPPSSLDKIPQLVIAVVSLMQISTREKDWIVDTLRPWRHKLQVLNEVFADPKIIKVFTLSSTISMVQC